MTALLLLCATLAVVMLPMLPAIWEWHFKADVGPLFIDTQDAQDPAFLARSFAAHLSEAIVTGQRRLGRSQIALAPAGDDWPLTDREMRDARSRRVWHAAEGAELPFGVNFLGEVAARGNLHTADGSMYRALWSGSTLVLAGRSTVLRWAHGLNVVIGRGCRLAGRVSADQCIDVQGKASFTMLHAPAIRFLGSTNHPVSPLPLNHSMYRLGLPDGVVWNAVAGRGMADGSLDVGAYRAWRGDLVCRADLFLGVGCNVHGSIKAHGDAIVDAHCSIDGNLICESSVSLGQGCTVTGSLTSEVAIVIGEGCVLGLPDRPATVAAPSIRIAAGVVVHGTVWAGTSGRAQAKAGAGGDTVDSSPALAVAAAADAAMGLAAGVGT